MAKLTRIVLPTQAVVKGNVSMAGFKLVKLGNPSGASDAVNLGYLQTYSASFVKARFIVEKANYRSATQWEVIQAASTGAIITNSESVYLNGVCLAPTQDYVLGNSGSELLVRINTGLVTTASDTVLVKAIKIS